MSTSTIACLASVRGTVGVVRSLNVVTPGLSAYGRLRRGLGETVPTVPGPSFDGPVGVTQVAPLARVDIWCEAGEPDRERPRSDHGRGYPARGGGTRIGGGLGRAMDVDIWREAGEPLPTNPLMPFPLARRHMNVRQTTGHRSLGAGAGTTQTWSYITTELPTQQPILRCLDEARHIIPIQQQLSTSL